MASIIELRKYLKSKGADIEQENDQPSIEGNLAKVIAASDILWKEEQNDASLESIFNNIIALLMVLPYSIGESMTLDFCERMSQITAGDKRNIIRLRLLQNLFYGLEESSPGRYVVYMSLLKAAGLADHLSMVNPKLEEIKEWVAKWGLSTEKAQTLLRALHDAFVASKQGEKATKVMLELLSTYTEQTADQARSDAVKCIVTCLSDPSTYVFDHLLALKPVKSLEGQPIHNLLKIFVNGTLSDYRDFANKNKDFIASLGLSDDQNIRKMRILTFAQMAETQTEISYDTIQSQLELTAEQVEPFIIDVVRTKTVQVRVDQLAHKVTISGTTHRTFGTQQWHQLKDHLDNWQQSLGVILASLQTVSVPR